MTLKEKASDPSCLPLLNHPLHEPTVFRPEDLVQAVRQQRRLGKADMPEVCVLDFDGDLTDALIENKQVSPCAAWPCFHTALWTWELDGLRSGIIARTIGGPYAVLVAEQLAVCGVRVIVGLASAGRVGSLLPVPGVVVADQAIRDEGTSYHYLPRQRDRTCTARYSRGARGRSCGCRATGATRPRLDDGRTLP